MGKQIWKRHARLSDNANKKHQIKEKESIMIFSHKTKWRVDSMNKILLYIATFFILSIYFTLISQIIVYYEIPAGGITISLLTIILFLSIKNHCKKYFSNDLHYTKTLFFFNLFFGLYYSSSFNTNKEAILSGIEVNLAWLIHQPNNLIQIYIF